MEASASSLEAESKSNVIENEEPTSEAVSDFDKTIEENTEDDSAV